METLTPPELSRRNFDVVGRVYNDAIGSAQQMDFVYRRTSQHADVHFCKHTPSRQTQQQNPPRF